MKSQQTQASGSQNHSSHSSHSSCGTEGKNGSNATGWATVPLGEMIEKIETIDPRKEPKSYFRYVDVSSVSNRTLKIEEPQLLKGADAPSRARRRVRANDVIFATVRPTLRRIAMVPKSLDGEVCSTGYFVIRPKADLDSRFVFYFLQSDNFMERMESLQKGASYPAVTDREMRSQPIPVPPLPEQERIVAILDEAFEGIATATAHAERNLHNARELFQSVLQSTFQQKGEDWVETTLGDACKMYQPKTISKKDLVEDGPYPVFGANGIIGQYDQFNHQDPQVLVTCRGATCGAVNVSDPFSWITGNAMVVQPLNANLNLRFLEYALRGGVDLSTAITGAAQPQITRTNLNPIPFGYPQSIKTQKAIVQKLDALATETRRLEAIYQRKLAALAELKQSLLQRAFAGEL